MSKTHVYLSKEAAAIVEFKDSELDRLRAELAAKDARIAENQRKADLYDATLIDTDNEALRKELAATVSQRDEWQDCHKSVSEELAEAKRCRDNAENVLEAAKARVAELDRDNTAMREQLDRDHAAMVEGTASIVALRKELAEWKEQFRVLGLLEQQKTAALEAAKARVAELEAALLADMPLFEQVKRALRAEAECKALRELLDWIYDFLAYVDSYRSRRIRDKVCAALNPSPAEKSPT